MSIPFNKPLLPPRFKSNVGKMFRQETILQTLGPAYQFCRTQLITRYSAKDVILTPSCTAALELAALTLNILPGDEIIMPSFTYVATANAFVLRGADPVFVDCAEYSAQMDVSLVEEKITPRTRAVIVVHYGGVAGDMEALVRICKKHKLILIEDAAHSIGANLGDKPLGTFGDLATLSFHETKNISCGQGGALILNNPSLVRNANIISQSGTDRIDFIAQKKPAYSWVRPGSNYLLAEPLATILSEGLKMEKKVTRERLRLWKYYFRNLRGITAIRLPELVPESQGNGHVFYFFVKNKSTRDRLIAFLGERKISAVFHYQPLHSSPYFKHHGLKLKNAEFSGDTIVRLPMFFGLTRAEQDRVIGSIKEFFNP